MIRHEFGEIPGQATQEDVSYAMQATEEALRRYGWPMLPEAERVVAAETAVQDEAPEGHVVVGAVIPGERLQTLFPDFHRQWQVGDGVEVQWQGEHSKMKLGADGFAAPVHVPAMAMFMIHKAEAAPVEVETVSLHRDTSAGEAVYMAGRLMTEDFGNDTSIMPGDTPTEPVEQTPLTSLEVQELEAIVHLLPLLLRPNN